LDTTLSAKKKHAFQDFPFVLYCQGTEPQKTRKDDERGEKTQEERTHTRTEKKQHHKKREWVSMLAEEALAAVAAFALRFS